MVQATGSVCKQCRRQGVKLFLKGERCLSDNCAMERRPYPPGEHGKRRRRPSPYALMLQEKQKTRLIYGVNEKQFHKYYLDATGMAGRTGENLLIQLERRLDNVVYRLGFAFSRNHARQIVRHGHIAVDSRKINIPSYLVSPGQTIELTERGKESAGIKEAVERAAVKPRVPSWLEADYEKLTGKVNSMPIRDDIDIPVDENKIVELYSK